mgnify:CR=1 FL=1
MKKLSWAAPEINKILVEGKHSINVNETSLASPEGHYTGPGHVFQSHATAVVPSQAIGNQFVSQALWTSSQTDLISGGAPGPS